MKHLGISADDIKGMSADTIISLTLELERISRRAYEQGGGEFRYEGGPKDGITAITNNPPKDGAMFTLFKEYEDRAGRIRATGYAYQRRGHSFIFVREFDTP